jgi:RNA polymerase sigma-70 factor, ECF subfamily
LANFINRMIFDWDEAQSLTQDVFLQVYVHLDRYRQENNFQAFVFTIARNLTFNWLKKRKRLVFFSRLTGGAPPPEPVVAGDPGEFQTDREELSDQLTAALRTVPEEQRLALILKIYLEMSYRQIAEITGWSEPKIETLIFRAKKKLRQLLLQERE